MPRFGAFDPRSPEGGATKSEPLSARSARPGIGPAHRGADFWARLGRSPTQRARLALLWLGLAGALALFVHEHAHRVGWWIEGVAFVERPVPGTFVALRLPERLSPGPLEVRRDGSIRVRFGDARRDPLQVDVAVFQIGPRAFRGEREGFLRAYVDIGEAGGFDASVEPLGGRPVATVVRADNWFFEERTWTAVEGAQLVVVQAHLDGLAPPAYHDPGRRLGAWLLVDPGGDLAHVQSRLVATLGPACEAIPTALSACLVASRMALRGGDLRLATHFAVHALRSAQLPAGAREVLGTPPLAGAVARRPLVLLAAEPRDDAFDVGELLLLLAQLRWTDGDVDGAKAVLRLADRRDHDARAAHMLASLHLEAAGTLAFDAGEAMASARHASRAGRPEHLLTLARLHEVLGDYDSARDAVERALASRKSLDFREELLAIRVLSEPAAAPCPTGTRPHRVAPAGAGSIDLCLDGRGRANGPFLRRDALGRPYARGRLRDDLTDGEISYFHPNGRLARSGKERAGWPEGTQVEFSPAGAKRSEEQWSGRRAVRVREFDEEGRLVAELLERGGGLEPVPR